MIALVYMTHDNEVSLNRLRFIAVAYKIFFFFEPQYFVIKKLCDKTLEKLVNCVFRETLHLLSPTKKQTRYHSQRQYVIHLLDVSFQLQFSGNTSSLHFPVLVDRFFGIYPKNLLQSFKRKFKREKSQRQKQQQQHTTPNGICSKVHFGNAQKSIISIPGEAFSYGELMVSMKLMQLTWPDRTTGQIENVGQMKCNRKLYQGVTSCFVRLLLLFYFFHVRMLLSHDRD